MKRSKSRIAFVAANNLFMTFMIVVTVYPLYYVLIGSFSDPNQLMMSEGLIWKFAGFSLKAYEAVFRNRLIWSGYMNTVIITVFGTALSVVLTVIAGYFFSRYDVMHKRMFMLMIVFTMYFNGGLIPTYLLVRGLGLENTLLALIIPGCLSATNIIIMRTAFYAVPKSLEEAAAIDGAGHIVILLKVFTPLVLPTVAVMMLYAAVGLWNSWFNASIYLRDRTLYPLQLILREILINNDISSMDKYGTSIDEKVNVSETIKYAVIIVATVPILCIYPFLQKHFVKGVMIGAVKE